jgi:hypothetical protein
VPYEEIAMYLTEENVIGGIQEKKKTKSSSSETRLTLLSPLSPLFSGGGFGKVYRGELRQTPCAIKTFKGLSPGMSQLADTLAGIRVV